MKNLILTISAFIFISFSVNAQVSSSANKTTTNNKKPVSSQTQSTAESTNPNAPVVEFDKLVHDYGTMEQYGNGKCEFKFTNTGKEPLILSNVRSSCGCTVPEWPRQPILPGKSDVIKVKYDTKRVGMINKSVHVYSNAKKSPISLKIKGKINAKAQASPPVKKVENTSAPVNK